MTKIGLYWIPNSNYVDTPREQLNRLYELAAIGEMIKSKMAKGYRLILKGDSVDVEIETLEGLENYVRSEGEKI